MDIKLTIVSLAIYALAFILVSFNRDRVRTAGIIAAIAAFLIQTAALLLRWAASYSSGDGHAPVSNFYESLVVLSWSFMLISLVSWRIKKTSVGVAIALPFSIIILACANFYPGIESTIRPLVPALKSNWLLIHVMTCMAGYAALALGSVLAVFSVTAAGGRTAGKNDTAHSFLLFGFIIFSFGVMTGALWAQTAWGRYWGWDPKETFSLITWLIYAALLHAGKRGDVNKFLYAGLAISGLLCMLFTYLGVNYLPGLHSYF